jgi:hypothetical protein
MGNSERRFHFAGTEALAADNQKRFPDRNYCRIVHQPFGKVAQLAGVER